MRYQKGKAHGLVSKRSQSVIDAAIVYANYAHTYRTRSGQPQVRKYNGEPYIEHPLAVARMVSHATDGDLDSVVAAILHDVLEDTMVTFEEIKKEFGLPVANLVDELTDVSKPKDGNRAARKSIDRAHTAMASPKAKTIKLADLIHNTKSIVANDSKFAAIYLKEKQLLLEVLTEGETRLYYTAMHTLNESIKELNNAV